MKINVIVNFVLFSFCIGFFFSCGHVRKLPDSKKQISGMEAMSMIKIPKGKALVYILRPSVVGSAIRMPVTIDGKKIGSTHGKRFLYAFVESGNHIIKSKAEVEDEISVELESNKQYFIKQKMTMGLAYTRNKLTLVPENEAIGMMQKCKLADNNIETAGFENNPLQKLNNSK